MKAMRAVWNGAAAVRRHIMGCRELYGRREGWGGEYRKRPPSGGGRLSHTALQVYSLHLARDCTGWFTSAAGAAPGVVPAAALR